MSQYLDLTLMNILSSQSHLDIYNDLVILIEMIIALSVLLTMATLSFNWWSQNFKHWIILEFIWTLTPVSVLLMLGLPSIEMVYSLEMTNMLSDLTIKILGYQWYWNYSFCEFNISFESYPMSESDLFRLGESSLLVIPAKSNIRYLISSGDVIHSWTLPSLGLKMDAVPGRLNLLSAEILMMNKHIGQCSELCGNYHSWMPIYLESVLSTIFFEWLKQFNN